MFNYEQVCLRELRERVGKGGDPTKLREPPVQYENLNVEQGMLLANYDVTKAFGCFLLHLYHCYA